MPPPQRGLPCLPCPKSLMELLIMAPWACPFWPSSMLGSHLWCDYPSLHSTVNSLKKEEFLAHLAHLTYAMPRKVLGT